MKAVGLLVACLALASAPAFGWSAKKVPPVASQSHGKKPAKPNQPPPNAAEPQGLADRAQAALNDPHAPWRTLVALLREAVAARQTDVAAQLVVRLEQAPNLPLDACMEAATAAGNESAGARRLWQKAWQLGSKHRQFGPAIAEGYCDALLAQGAAEAARDVVQEALKLAGPGQRRGLYERLAAAARVLHEVDETAMHLGQRGDPDACVVAAQLQGEAGADEAALELLQTGWKRWPGHRALQAALMQLLTRLGRRDELRQVIDQVVRLAPADPMPYVQLVDADIAARDHYAARQLIDELAKRYPRHDVLLEALVDREQRMGDEGARIRHLYDLLLAAAPDQDQYVEAFAEWLIGRGRGAEAVELLGRVGKHAKGKDGLFKQAQVLIAHRLGKQARDVVDKLAADLPTDPRVVRLQAQVAELQGQIVLAERLWGQLCALKADASGEDRKRAADARQSYVALLRREHTLQHKRSLLEHELAEAGDDLGLSLLYLELASHSDGEAADEAARWQKLALQFAMRWPADGELLSAVAGGLLHRDRLAEALQVCVQLRGRDPDGAEGLLQQLLDASLARGMPKLAADVETAILQRRGAGGVSASALLKLGDLHLRYGDSDGAISLYRRAAAVRADSRATAKLAALYRQTGQPELEEAALRELVQHCADPDELETAGQRLVTVALVRGQSADLVRWFDAIAPQHPRRDGIARLRSAAYDIWLRSAGTADVYAADAPSPGPTGDALASSDLAQQIRALRLLAAARRTPPAAMARQLAASANSAIRRDVALALGAAGSTQAAEILRDILAEGVDNDDDVRCAQLLALANLPMIDGLDPALDALQLRQRGDVDAPLLNILAIGARGSAALADALLRSWGQREVPPWAVLAAAGAMARRVRDLPEADRLSELVRAEAERSAAGTDLSRQVAAVWALRASDNPRWPEILARVAVRAANPAVRRAALALLAETNPPELRLQLPALGQGYEFRDVKSAALRGLLAPWVSARAAAMQAGLDRHAARLEAELRAAPAAAANWCEFLARTGLQAAVCR